MIPWKNKLRLFSLSVAVVFAGSAVFGTTTSVFALDKADNAAINNNWENWVADQVCVIPSEIDGPISGSDNIEKAYNFFLQKGLADFQAAGIVGNFMEESPGVNPATGENNQDSPTPVNGIGFGIAQWTFSDRQIPLMAHAKSMNQPVNTLAPQLGFSWKELNGTYASALKNLRASKTVEAATDVILNQYELPKERIENLKKRIAHAKSVLARYGGNSAATNTVINANSNCISGSGAVAGSAVQTALKYSWNDRRDHGPEKKDAVRAYQDDMPRYNGAVDALPFSDCGVFVSTVMIASGVDKDYPKRDTRVQMEYLKSNPKKYQQLPASATRSTAKLQPGDILINTGHTYMYIGEQSNGTSAAGASWKDHVPQTSGFYQDDDPFQIFRPLASTEVKA